MAARIIAGDGGEIDPHWSLARVLAPMLYTQPEFIESQGKGSFAAHVRGQTRHAVPLEFPFGYPEDRPKMSPDGRRALQNQMRKRYAVHHSKLEARRSARDKSKDASAKGAKPDTDAPDDPPPGRTDTTPGEQW